MVIPTRTIRRLALAWLLSMTCRAAVPAEPLARIEDVRSLPKDRAAEELPVRIRGVVMLVSPGGFYFHDGRQGIWVDTAIAHHRSIEPERGLRPGELARGSSLELEGLTNADNYCPQIVATGLRFLGPGDLPAPAHPPMESLLTGAEGGQWIEMEGVVQDIGQAGYSKQVVLMLAVGGHSCRVSFENGRDMDPSRLVDCGVRIRGVYESQVNLRSEAAGLQMHADSIRDITVISPAPPDPFLAPRVTTGRLLPFSPGESPDHRKVARGTVTFVDPGRFFYMQDGVTGVRVDSADTTVKTGDEVEVSGFVSTEYKLASLRYALVRNLGRGKIPAPLPVTSTRLLHPPMQNPWTGEANEDWSGRRISLTGRLLRIEIEEGGEHMTLMVESDGEAFSAYLPASLSPDRKPPWTVGSDIRINGTCELEFRENPAKRNTARYSIAGFHLWLSSPQDLTVLHAPSWWTPVRLWLALGGTLLVLLIALAWVLLLRLEVARRGARLAEEIAARREAAVEFDTRLRERTRLANDLHDTLEQALTGLSLQLQAADLFRDSDPEKSSQHLLLAQQFLDRSREDVHRTVWDLRVHGLDGTGLIDALRERAGAMVAGRPVTITVEEDGTPRSMPDVIAGNLLLLAQEAITNALKHAAPQQISARISFLRDEVWLEVRDDGCGFEVDAAPGHRDGHFGLQGMRERVKRLGGQLRIESTPGGGTRIEVRVPDRAFDDSPGK